MTFEDAQEETDFLGADNVQTHMAIEVNCVETDQGVIAGGGAMYFGGILIVPRFAYDSIGGSEDDDGVLTRTLRGMILEPTAADEGSTDPVQIYAYAVADGYLG
jgi:hypothetical protein